MTANHTIDEVSAALRKHRGLYFPTAKALGISRQAVQQRVKKSVVLQSVVDEAKLSVKDTAEDKLHDAIENGDPWAIQFYLKTQARDRGYGETTKHEVSGLEGKPIEVRREDDFDFTEFTDLFRVFFQSPGVSEPVSNGHSPN